MLQHVVALTWNESVPENYAEVVNKALLDMAKTIPSVRSYRCGYRRAKQQRLRV